MYQNKHNLLLKTAFLCLYFPLSVLLNIKISSAALTHTPTIEILVSSLASTSLMFFFMSFFELFRNFRFFPRKSDLAIVTLLILSVESLIRVSLMNLTLTPVASLPMLFEKTLILSIAWYSTHLLIAQLLKLFNYRLNILFLGHAEDLTELNSLIKPSPNTEFFKFHLWNEYQNFNSSDLVIYSPRCTQDENLKYHLIQLTISNLQVLDARDLLEDIEGHVDLSRQSETDIFKWVQNLSVTSKFYLRVKALYEPVIAMALLISLSPIMLLTALAVKLSSPGPVLFLQKRLGIGGKTFNILKFRTMRVDAEADGAQWAKKNDPRITPIGNILRALHLDELPQLINIINGDVSFVGPRPERPEFYAQLKNSIPLFYLRTVIRPGVTGWAQVWAGYAATVEASNLKLSYDLYYMKNMGLRMDISSVLLTFIHVIRKIFLAENSLSEQEETSITISLPPNLLKKVAPFGKRTLVVLILTTLAISVSSIAFG